MVRRVGAIKFPQLLTQKADTIKAFRLTAAITFFLLAGCSKPEHPATLASAEEFSKLLIEQLQLAGTAEGSMNGSAGQAGNVYTKDFSYQLSSSNFPPSKLYDAAQIALKKWGKISLFSTQGLGGGNGESRGSFNLHYGSHQSQAFIDVVAYPEKDKTRVDFSIRVLE